jgi:hypothetical protein
VRFMVTIKDEHNSGHGIPTVIDSASIDEAIAEFIERDAGANLRDGYFIEVTQAGRPRQRYAYFGKGKPTWIPSF